MAVDPIDQTHADSMEATRQIRRRVALAMSHVNAWSPTPAPDCRCPNCRVVSTYDAGYERWRHHTLCLNCGLDVTPERLGG